MQNKPAPALNLNRARALVPASVPAPAPAPSSATAPGRAVFPDPFLPIHAFSHVWHLNPLSAPNDSPLFRRKMNACARAISMSQSEPTKRLPFE
jgi:hypothetical protein